MGQLYSAQIGAISLGVNMKIRAGQVAVITGAGGGLGSALARNLAARGCGLALVDINQGALDQLKESLPESAGLVTTHIVDISKRQAVADLRRDVLKAHHKVNLLINNAGITLQKNFLSHTIPDWQRVIGINLMGVIYNCFYFEHALSTVDEGHVVNLASMSSFAGLPNQSSYCVTKSGVDALSECIWAEWKPRGIGVTCVHPGAIKTDMILATLEESDDVEAARKNYDMAMKMGIDADVAAKKIIKAVEKNKKKLRIGKESFLIDYMKRFAPGILNYAFGKIAMKQANEMPVRAAINK